MDKQKNINRKDNEKSINLIDILMYLAVNWKWFLFSVLLFVGYTLFSYYRAPFVYSRSSKVIIKDADKSSQSLTRMNRTYSYRDPSNVASEMLQFRSKELMRKVVDRLHTDVSYTVKDNFRVKELYQESPVSVSLLDMHADSTVALLVTPKDEKQVYISATLGNLKLNQTADLGDTLRTSVGRIVVNALKNYKASAFGKKIKVTKYSRESMMEYYLSNLKVSQPDEDAPVLQIMVNDYSAKRAEDMVSMLVAIFNEDAVEDKNQVAMNTAEFIKGRLDIIEGDLGSVETDLETRQKANDGMDLELASELYTRNILKYTEMANNIDVQLKVITSIKRNLGDLNKAEDFIPSNTVEDQTVQNQIVRYNELLLKRKRLLENSTANNPVVQEMSRSMESMRVNLVQVMDNVISNLNMQKMAISSEGNLARKKVLGVPEKSKQLGSVSRQQKVKENLYVYLLNKREDNALSLATTDDNARTFDPPSGARSPIYPNLYKKLLMGIGGGIAVPTVILLTILMLDTRVYTRKDIEDQIDVSFLAEIPQVGNKKDYNRILVHTGGRDALSEAFRILRTNMEFIATQTEKKVITLTSFNVGAGKTFVTSNLAASLVQTGKKVIVLDLDLRKGTISKRLGQGYMKGVAHYLSNPSVKVDDIIQKSNLAEVDLIPIGVVAPNPVELLLDKRLDELTVELRKRYDYIIVDSVPVGVVADTNIINRISDLTVFVVRSGKLDRRQLPELERLYQEQKYTNLTVLLNGVLKDKRGYGYGYGYGYGNEEHKKSWWKKVAGASKKHRKEA